MLQIYMQVMVFLKNLRYGSMMSSFLAHTDNVKFKCLETKIWALHFGLGTSFINTCKYKYSELSKGCLCIKTREIYKG